MNGRLERKIALGFGAALVLMSVIAIVSLKSARQFVHNSQWEDHTRQVLSMITDLSADVSGAEAAGRGYVLSADADFLNAYHTAANEAIERVKDLRSLTADNPDQQRRLDQLAPLLKHELTVLDAAVAAPN